MVGNVNRELYVDQRSDGDRAARVVKVLANVKFRSKSLVMKTSKYRLQVRDWTELGTLYTAFRKQELEPQAQSSYEPICR